MKRSAFAFAVAGAMALAAAREASAFERQQHVGIDTAGAVMSTDNGGTQFGGSLGLHYTYGLLDSLNLAAEANTALLVNGTKPAKNPAPQPGVVATGGVGAMYIFDVLRWVPYGGALVGPAYLGGGFMSGGLGTLDVQLCLGLDYQINRSWTVGATYRQHLFVFKMDTYPEFTTLGLRFEYTWGW